ncbi:hypothetical protein [Henriciella pelagia]|jgi:hypothetical protein|uniref:Uncharacterized protein n=1 Tax=Henriciella pelagia TaxID=1977912 RepID=A0ABQ1JPN9_9PROT|nr:hypothetical protein [Henriciella pelagia]GGB74384.1 hypothetical protein GCM10011503_23860 [Henriciella pelagia]
MISTVSKSPFDKIYSDIMTEVSRRYEATVHWLMQRNDAEQLIIACVFILLLLWLMIRRSMRNKDGSTSRNFGGSVVLIMIFAFGLGWMLDSGGGSLAFMFRG